MAILLHNLLARAPKLNDVDAITGLLIACDVIEDGVSHYTKSDVLDEWQRSGFNLASDARVIVTHRGQVVGYVRVLDCEHVRVDMKACVHPDYRGRGIGTLLLRRAEVRARQHLEYAPAGARVVVHNTVSHANQTAKSLLEHEGYSLVSHLWRIVIETEDALQSYAATLGQDKLRLALDVPGPCAAGRTRIYEPSGLYVVRQYDVYEKELRAGKVLDKNGKLDTQLVTV